MKKAMKLTLLVCLPLLACALMFTACDSGNNSQVHVHSYTEWTITKPATCTTNGIKERDCSCGDIQTVEILATGEHQYGEWTITKAATCTEGGVQERVCTCGEKEVKNISATHSFGAWITTKEATCTENGNDERICSCGEKENRAIIASHSWVDATCVTVKTCTKCGLAEGTALGHTTATGICSRCNQEIMPSIALPVTPISTSVKFSSQRTTMKITSITYEFSGNRISFYYSGEKTYDNISGYSGNYFCGFTYKLYDAEGYVVASDTVSVRDISVGLSY